LEAVEAKLSGVFGYALIFKSAFNHAPSHYCCIAIRIIASYIVQYIAAALSPVFYESLCAIAPVVEWVRENRVAGSLRGIYAGVQMGTPPVVWEVAVVYLATLVRHRGYASLTATAA
jgi:hypothetical protein